MQSKGYPRLLTTNNSNNTASDGEQLPRSVIQDAETSLNLAKKSRFLELRGRRADSAEDPTALTQLVNSFLQWCTSRMFPAIIVQHEAERSVVSVSVAYPQLDRVRALLQQTLPAAQIERSGATKYSFKYECATVEAARNLANALAQRLPQPPAAAQ